jgi:hypothetical protein
MVTKGDVSYTLQCHIPNSYLGRQSREQLAEAGIESPPCIYAVRINSKTIVYPKSRKRYEALIAQMAMDNVDEIPKASIQCIPTHAKCGNCKYMMLSPTNKRLFSCSVKKDESGRFRNVIKRKAACEMWIHLTIK